jgi:hypothetical protein
VGQAAGSIGAVPMFTQYPMADNGDGRITGINDAAFMTTCWPRLKTLYQDLATLQQAGARQR